MQRIEFNLQSALDGARLVTRDGVEATDFTFLPEEDVYQYSAIVNGITYTYTDEGRYMVGRIDDLDLFLSVSYTDIIGNSITEPMLSAEEWWQEHSNEYIGDEIITIAQAYGNYVADYLTKNK